MNRPRLLCLVVTFLLVILPCMGQDSKYDSVISQTDALTREGKYIEAFAKAQEAILVDGSRFEAYYYAAYSLYKRGLFDQARPLAEQALAKAPEVRRAEVQKLIEVINSTNQIQGLIESARSAEAAELLGKAADGYTKAWEVAPSQDDLGLQAARLWIRVGDLTSAAKVLFRLKTHPRPAKRATAPSRSFQPLALEGEAPKPERCEPR